MTLTPASSETPPDESYSKITVQQLQDAEDAAGYVPWGIERFIELYSSIPFHAARAAKDPDYWKGLYSSRARW